MALQLLVAWLCNYLSHGSAVRHAFHGLRPLPRRDRVNLRQKFAQAPSGRTLERTPRSSNQPQEWIPFRSYGKHGSILDDAKPFEHCYAKLQRRRFEKTRPIRNV